MRFCLALALPLVLAGAAAAQEPPPAPTPPEAPVTPGAPAKEGEPAKEEDDPEVRRVREGLGLQRAWAEVGRRIAELETELGQAAEWVEKAILCVELADLEDRRAVAGLVRALEDEHPMVRAFALHGLARGRDEDLQRGGGAPLFAALIEALKVRAHYHRRVSRALLTRLAGQDLGGEPGRWKSWLKKNAERLPLDPAPPPFDLGAHDPALVARVQAEAGGDGTTSVRERIPPVASQLRELNRGGLDAAICLDQTGSMGAVLAEAKAKLALLTLLIGLVVEDHRLGLVTYDDGLKVFEPLTADVRRLRGTLDRVQAAGGDDLPEGVDKALEATCRPDFGWRRGAAKVVIIVGDAPPHAEDMPATLERARAMKEKLGIVTHGVSTGGQAVAELGQVAASGGGRALTLAEPARLVSEVLLLIFGEGLRPAMERFVPILMELHEEERDARRR